MRFSFRAQHIELFFLLIALSPLPAKADQPIISDRFPVTQSNLSPPIVLGPIHECAEAVEVSGFVPYATVRVFANSTELIGQANPRHTPDEIPLNRALVMGDVITSVQIVNSVSSAPSIDPVTVTFYPTLTTPVISDVVYECGREVPVGNLVASTHVVVSDLDKPPLSLIGAGEATSTWEPILTSKLLVGHRVSALQIACPKIATKTITSSPTLSPERVTAAPSAMPSPVFGPPSEYPPVGATQVVLHQLLVGAHVELNFGSTLVNGGYATAADNAVDVPPVPPGPITAEQTLCASSPPSPPVTATTTLPTPVLGGPICAGSSYVMIYQTYPNAIVVLLRGGKAIGMEGGVMGPLKLSINGSNTLAEGDSLSVIQYVSSSYGIYFSDISNVVTVGCLSSGDVVTQHNDNQRSGVYPAETTLTPAKVLAQGMRVRYTHPISGAVNTQPLYARGVNFQSGTANALFVASTHAYPNQADPLRFYALNADTGDEEWSVPLQDSDPHQRPFGQAIDPTPVLDIPNNRIYIAFATKNQVDDEADLPDSTHPWTDGKSHIYQDSDLKNLDTAFWVVALDDRTGNELVRTKVSASAYRADGSVVSFEAPFQREHPALLLDHGMLYLAFGAIAGSENFLEYHGWVMAYRAYDLSMQASFCTSRNWAPARKPYQFNNGAGGVLDGAGIWQGGGGLTADRDGNIFFLTGNGASDPANDKYGDAFMKLTFTGSSLVPAAYVPFDSDAMNYNDADLGGGGTLAIPDTDLMIGGGKPGYMFLMDRKTMRLQQRFTASTNTYSPSSRDNLWNSGPHLHGSPTYWRGPDPTFGKLYVWGEKDRLNLFRFNAITEQILFKPPTPGGLPEEPDFQGAVVALPVPMPGGIISVSSNGNRPGTGIVWATLPASNSAPVGRFYAFDAEDLKALWDSPLPRLGHWSVPTIADGKVFVGTSSVGTSSGWLICFELGGTNQPARTPQPPFQPHNDLQEHVMGTNSGPSIMTTLPANTLNALAPPARFVKYAVLDGDGFAEYAAEAAPDGHLSWTPRTFSLHAQMTLAGQVFPQKEGVQLSVSSNLEWRASDGSKARTHLLKSFTAPAGDSLPWQLYEVTRTQGNGLLAGVAYVQRVFTSGGLPPMGEPASNAATRQMPLQVEYILYRRPGSGVTNK